MPSIAIYVLGFIVVIAGLAMGARLLGIPESWILVGIIILAGIMILSLAARLNGRL